MIKLIVYFALSMSLFYAIQPYIALPFWLVGWEWMLGLNVALISVALSLGLMILLYRFPEWYVVNGVGVLVGAGVVTPNFSRNIAPIATAWLYPVEPRL